MNARLAADLGRWERGDLRAGELADRHPGDEASDLVQAHAWLSLQTSVTDEEPDLSWEELEGRLDIDLDAEAERDREHESARRARRVPFVKLAVAFVAGALANPVSPAAQGFANVRDAARGVTEAVVEEVTEVFEPIVPPQNVGVVVVHPIEEQKVSVVSSDDAEVPGSPMLLAGASEGATPAATPAAGDGVADAPVADDRGPVPADPTAEQGPDDPADSTEPVVDGGGSDAPDSPEPSPEPEPHPAPGDEETASKPPRPSHAHAGAAGSWTPPGHVNKPAHAAKGGLAAAVAAAGESAHRPGPPSEPPGRAKGRHR